MQNMKTSSVRVLSRYAAEAAGKGRKIYQLNIGQPDLPTPDEYFRQIRAFHEPNTSYMASLGIPELIRKIREYYLRIGIEVSENQIAVTNGGTEALQFALLSICNPGESILVPEPYYSNYNNIATVTDVRILTVPTYAEDGFHFSMKDLEKNIQKDTKAIMLSTPGNPTGAVLSMEEIRAVADIAKRHDLYVIADEVYREFVFDNRPVASFGFLDDMDDRLILIDSVSKRYSACGARIGALITKNPKVFRVVEKLCQGRLACSTVEQLGAIGLYSVSEDQVRAVRDIYQSRRDAIVGYLEQIPGVVFRKPEGAFYMIAKLPVLDVHDFLIWMLTDFHIDNETMMAAPADGFYKTEGLGEDEIRIAYVLEEEDLKKAMNILKEGLAEYTRLHPERARKEQDR